jgi:hypothetical protein
MMSLRPLPSTRGSNELAHFGGTPQIAAAQRGTSGNGFIAREAAAAVEAAVVSACNALMAFSVSQQIWHTTQNTRKALQQCFSYRNTSWNTSYVQYRHTKHNISMHNTLTATEYRHNTLNVNGVHLRLLTKHM